MSERTFSTRPTGATGARSAVMEELRLANEQLVKMLLCAQNRDDERQAYYAQVLARIEDVVIETDERRVITAWNPAAAAMYGCTAEEALGRSLPDVTHPEGAPVGHLPPATPVHWEEIHQRKDGHCVHVAGTTLPLHDEAGRIRGYLTVSHDTTLLKRKEQPQQQIAAVRQEVDQLKSAFLMMMTHELRTPFNPILGFTRLLLDGTLGDVSPDQAQALNMVLAAGDSLLKIIDEILYVTHLEAGQIALQMEDVTLEEVVAEALQPFTEAPASNCPQVSKEGLAVRIRTDRYRLRQVLSRILDNAARFATHGSIRIHVLEKGDDVAIRVSDSGIGFVREDLDQIFGRFHQLSSSAGRRYEGIGLSLYTCHKIVELLGGSLAAECTPERGSTFTVLLPKVAPDDAPTTSAGGSPESGARESR